MILGDPRVHVPLCTKYSPNTCHGSPLLCSAPTPVSLLRAPGSGLRRLRFAPYNHMWSRQEVSSCLRRHLSYAIFSLIDTSAWVFITGSTERLITDLYSEPRCSSHWSYSIIYMLQNMLFSCNVQACFLLKLVQTINCVKSGKERISFKFHHRLNMILTSRAVRLDHSPSEYIS